MQGGARFSAPVQSACRGYPRALWRSVLNWSRVWGLGVWAVISSLRAAAGHTGTTLSAASRRGTWILGSPPHCVPHQLLEATAGTQPRSRPPGVGERAASAGVPAHEVPAVPGIGRYHSGIAPLLHYQKLHALLALCRRFQLREGVPPALQGCCWAIRYSFQCRLTGKICSTIVISILRAAAASYRQSQHLAPRVLLPQAHHAQLSSRPWWNCFLPKKEP